MYLDPRVVAPLTALEGIGVKTAGRFRSLGVNSVQDLLFLFPRAYEDRTALRSIPELVPGGFSVVRGEVFSLGEKGFRRSKVLEVLLTDGRGILVLKWFHYGKWLKENLEGRFPPGTAVLASGKVAFFAGKPEMHHPEIAPAQPGEDVGIVPVYPLAEGLGQRLVRKAVSSALKRNRTSLKEWIPAKVLEDWNLPDLETSVAALHVPPPDQDVEALNEGQTPWHERIRFGELLAFQLGLLSRKRDLNLQRSRPVPWASPLADEFIAGLPFELSGSQKRALDEIARDMEKGHPMHRLLQGDVGSGKTVVAYIAMLRAAAAGRQAILMAPTEVLARQHYRTFLEWSEKTGIQVGFFTGNMGKNLRSELREKTERGDVSLVVGTHALIQEGVLFKDLALAVVDEQHRFGVLQRMALKEKGECPHFLVMTATPIPRSLSMVLYGDLDVSVIDELPAGRRPVKTILFEDSDRARMYLRIANEVRGGGQVFIVYPLIEESEKIESLAASAMAEKLRKNIFPNLGIGLLTGRMPSAEKEEIMSLFRSGKVQVLVATTVIEVGIDVPDASLMVIENAERFGLFQLHQLRGRVGRGQRESTCILMAGQNIGEDAIKRLRTLTATHSGFRIAEEDLRMRGPGDFLGVRQSGLPCFRFADPFRDGRLLGMAVESARKILSEPGGLSGGLRDKVADFWSSAFNVAGSG